MPRAAVSIARSTIPADYKVTSCDAARPPGRRNAGGVFYFRLYEPYKGMRFLGCFEKVSKFEQFLQLGKQYSANYIGAAVPRGRDRFWERSGLTWW